MPTTIGIGFSQHPDPHKAVLDACVQIKNQLNSLHTDLIILFASPEYIFPEMHGTITRTLRPKRLVGSSTGSIILGTGAIHHGVAMMGINSDDILFGISAVEDIERQEPRLVGHDLAHKAAVDLKSPQREVFISFSNGIEKNCSYFVRGMQEALGLVFPILGGISSDHFKYQRLTQFFQDQNLTNSSVGLLIGGNNFKLGIGLAHGFKPLGKPRTITKSEGYIIHTIDDTPAIDIYKHFLGADADNLRTATLTSYANLYPLGIYQEATNAYLLRNVIDILPDGSIVCHEGVTEGAEVHLMISNADACQFSAADAAKLARASLGEERPRMVLIFESMTRQRILRENSFGEIRAIKEILGPATPMLGLCTYGELGPFGTLNNIKNIHLHNSSILIIAIA